MIFRVQILLISILLVSGCSHIKTSETTAPEPVLKAEGNNTLPEQVPTESGELEPITTYPIEPDQIEQPAAPTDLIARIRSGFRFPDYSSKHVQQYERWNSQHPTYLRDLFTRAEPFLYYIVEELDKRNLPLDLALLPAVESAFKPAARSRSAAAGLWQFVPATGRHFGLRQDWWYDGRLDAILATQAALDYLEELHAMFDNDWFLALAAYNAGQGTVRKAIKRNKSKGKKAQYADLVLRSETVRYVPKLFALRNIIANPSKYGVTLPVIANEPHFSVLKLPGQIDLQRFSKESGIDINALRHLNAAHKRWATSPQGPHRLLIPLSSYDQALATADRFAKEPSIKFQNHQIRRGDNLSSIATRYGVSVSSIQQANNIRGTAIRAGKSLVIPVAASFDRNRVSVATTSAASADEKKIVHRVVAGDTLWSIAKRYQVHVAELLNWNQLSTNQVLSLDQALLVFLN